MEVRIMVTSLTGKGKEGTFWDAVNILHYGWQTVAQGLNSAYCLL